MNNIVYLKEPGILYDMLFALKLRFNGERAYVPLRSGNFFNEQNECFYRLIIEKLSHITNILLPLFYYDKDKGISTGMVTYVREFINLTAFQESGLIEQFYTSLRDVNRLKRCIYKNYISNDCPDDFDKNTFWRVKDNLFNADLPSDVKMHLYDFFIYGENEIEEIITELRSVEAICREINQIHQLEIERLFAKFESDHLQPLSMLHCVDILQYDNIYVSYYSIIKEYLNFETYGKAWLSLLCLQVSHVISEYSFIDYNFDVYELSRVLDDKQRLKILNLLFDKDMYCAEIARELGLKPNSTIYHLNLMERVGLITNQKIGRKIYYSINQNYFYALRNFIDSKLGEIKK